jgi:hypothetical protein
MRPHVKRAANTRRATQAGTAMNAVLLKRTFTQNSFDGEPIRFWRVVSPEHRNYQSDLSMAGLIEWGIIPEEKPLCINALVAE